MTKYCCDRCRKEVRVDKHKIANYSVVDLTCTAYSASTGSTLTFTGNNIYCETCMEEISKFCKAKI